MTNITYAIVVDHKRIVCMYDGCVIRFDSCEDAEVAIARGMEINFDENDGHEFTIVSARENGEWDYL